MKTLQKIVVTGALIALIPMSIHAQDRDEEYVSSYFEDKIFAEKLKDANYEFDGRVDERPQSLSGTWVISGIEVIVNDKTYISHSENMIKVGDDVEVIAKREAGKVFALDLAQDD